MATTTPNFGWSVPTSTDLVKDGATAIELLGDSIDASLVDLKGGTTGQVLAKTSGTDMDFTWVTTDDTNAIQNAIVDAKGDLIGATAADTPARLAVGTNGQVLTADSTAATGLAWASSSSGLTLVTAQTIGSAVSSVTVSSAFSATYDNYLINVSGGVGSADANIALTLGATSSGYKYNQIYMLYSSATVNGENNNAGSNFPRVARGTTKSIDGEITLKNPFNTKRTTVQYRLSSAEDGQLWALGGGVLDDATSYTAFTLTPASGTLTGGTIRVYGYKNS